MTFLRNKNKRKTQGKLKYKTAVNTLTLKTLSNIYDLELFAKIVGGFFRRFHHRCLSGS